jgi:transcription elongation factor Elf1
MYRETKFGQGKCQMCQSFHWAIQLDDKMTITEVKCTRCGRIIQVEQGNVSQVLNEGKLKSD